MHDLPKRVFPTRIASLCVPFFFFFILLCYWCRFRNASLCGVIFIHIQSFCSRKKSARPMKFNNKLNGNTIKSREFAILKQFLLCVCYLHDLLTMQRTESVFQFTILFRWNRSPFALPLSRSPHITAFLKHYCICFPFGSAFSLFKWIHFICHANRE